MLLKFVISVVALLSVMAIITILVISIKIERRISRNKEKDLK